MLDSGNITEIQLIDSSTGLPMKQTGTAGLANEYEASLGAGDEGVSDPNLSTKRIINKGFLTQLANSAAAQNIGGGVGVPVYIKSLKLLRSSAGTITIFGISTPTSPASLATSIVIPATATTIPIDMLPAGIAHNFSAGCQIQCSVAADGLLILVSWEGVPS